MDEELELRLIVRDKEIREFITNIGAEWIPVLKRFNYFELNGQVLIVKISRTEKPFFGVSKEIIDILDDNKLEYFLVLLVSSKEGWLYSKKETDTNIKNGVWKLRAKDNNYKINFYTLKNDNLFISYTQFLNKLGM